MMENKETIQIILPRPSLERLISGDNELEVKLRHAAAQEIANKYLKNMVNESVQKASREIIDGFTQEYVQKVVANKNSQLPWNCEYTITRLVKEHLEQTLRKSVNEFINDTYERQHRENLIRARISDSIQKMVSDITEAVLRTQIEKLVNESVEKALTSIKAKLGTS